LVRELVDSNLSFYSQRLGGVVPEKHVDIVKSMENLAAASEP